MADADPSTTTDPTNSDSDGDGITDGQEDTNGDGAYNPDEGETDPTVIEVTIDIKPGSDPNCFNNDGHGVIPLAILGSADFDCTQIDPTTCTLSGLTLKIAFFALCREKKYDEKTQIMIFHSIRSNIVYSL